MTLMKAEKVPWGVGVLGQEEQREQHYLQNKVLTWLVQDGTLT
jgi:hypothetical protein